MATRKTKAEAAPATPVKPAAAVRKRATSATHTAPARKRPAAKPDAAAAAVEVPAQVITPREITTEQIAALAYSYWEARGCQGGSEADDWFRAEQELKSR